MRKKYNVVFLDRDGTLVHDRPGFYLRRPEQVRIYPFTTRALKLLREAGYKLIVVTNQSGLGQGFFTEATLKRINKKLFSMLEREGAPIDAMYYCPHVPEDACRCRKPKATLAHQAIRDHHLKLDKAAVIGDKLSDLELARNLGVKAIMLKTGHGRSQLRRYGSKLKADYLAPNLLSAARWLVATSFRSSGSARRTGRSR